MFITDAAFNGTSSEIYSNKILRTLRTEDMY